MSRGTTVREKRKEAGLTQEQVAKSIKVTQQTYSDFENDRIVNLRRSAVDALAKLLDIPVETLLIGERDTISKEARAIAMSYDRASRAVRERIALELLIDQQQRAANHDDSGR